MPASTFLDANVWLALIWEGHAHALAARRWLDQQADCRIVYCRFVQMTVLRLLTTPAILGGDALGMRGAWSVWDRITADDRVVYQLEPAEMEVRFRLHTRLETASPKVWADAYLLAFAETAKLSLVTLDRALASRLAGSHLLLP